MNLPVVDFSVVSGCSDASVVALKRAVGSFTMIGLQRSASLMPAGPATATGGLVHLRHDGIAYGIQLLLLMLVFILFSSLIGFQPTDNFVAFVNNLPDVILRLLPNQMGESLGNGLAVARHFSCDGRKVDLM